MVDYQVNLQPLNMEKHIPTVNKILKADNVLSSLNKLDSGGLQARSKEQCLGPCRAGVRGFKSHPPHHYSWFWMNLVYVKTMRLLIVEWDVSWLVCVGEVASFW